MLTREDGQYIEVDGLKTFYISKGTGRPLVLIHGGAPGACTLVSWRPNIDHFAKLGFRVYAPDQPGFGCTDNNPQDYSMEYRYRHAKAFIEKMGLGDFDMIANSQGAYIAARIALEDPRVQRLVFTASGTISPRGSEAAQKQMRAHGEQLRAYTPSLENIRTMTMKTLFHKNLVDDDLVQLRYEMSIGKNFEAQQKRRDAPPPKPLAPTSSAISSTGRCCCGARTTTAPRSNAACCCSRRCRTRSSTCSATAATGPSGTRPTASTTSSAAFSTGRRI